MQVERTVNRKKNRTRMKKEGGSSRTRGGGNKRIDSRRVTRRARRVGISSNAHDSIRLPLREDQLPLREDFGQPSLPFIIVMYDCIDELVHVYRSLFAGTFVPHLYGELNLRINPRYPRKLSGQTDRGESQISAGWITMGERLRTSMLTWVAERSATRLGRPS